MKRADALGPSPHHRLFEGSPGELADRAALLRIKAKKARAAGYHVAAAQDEEDAQLIERHLAAMTKKDSADAPMSRGEKLRAIVDGVDRLAARVDSVVADSSIDLEAAIARQRARIERAEAGIALGNALMAQVDRALAALKKRGETPYNGRAAQAQDSVKKALSTYGLAKGASSTKYESWIARADREMGEAAMNVRALEDQLSR